MIEKVLFIGSKQLGFEVLKEIVSIKPESVVGIITFDDRNDTRSVFDNFVNFSKEQNLNLMIAENRRHSEQLVREINPDLCLVVGWYWIIGNEALNTVKNGFIGIHNSLLPKYRGSSPLIWTMINGEPEAGFSLFSLTEKMDEGDIWASGTVPIEKSDSVSDVLKKLEIKTLETIRSIYPKILEGTATAIRQNHAEATYCSPRFDFDGSIDWNKSSQEIYDFIRAQTYPYPGAFTYLNGEKIIIWKAKLNDVTYYGTTGQVARIDENGVYVICGNQQSIILEIVEIKNEKSKAEKVIRSVKSRFSKNI